MRRFREQVAKEKRASAAEWKAYVCDGTEPVGKD